MDGPFQTPKCHFGTVEVINAPGKGVKQLTKYMGYLVNLTKLSLPQNDIEKLPREITKLKKISSVNLQGNPVWTHLDWTHQGFTSYPKILDYFTDLQGLNLGYNNIETIPDSIEKLQKLSKLTEAVKAIEILNLKLKPWLLLEFL